MVELTQTIQAQILEEHPLDKMYRLQREDAINEHKENVCKLCINYGRSSCKNSFDNQGNCWFYTRV